MHTSKILDFVAIGIGPFNLGLACLTAPLSNIDGIFLDKRDHFNWHPGMLLQDTTLQVPFMADLVSLADPTSKFSFLNYLKEQGRIYQFYIRENFLILRNEYNNYCQWVVKQLPNILFQTEVIHTAYSENENCYIVKCKCTKTESIRIYRAKKIIMGTGTVPYIPACVKEHTEQVVHSSSYLDNKAQLQTKKSITVVGSGQSAAEIFYDLLLDIDQRNYELNWITRSPRYFPLEYSKLTLEMTSPEYVDYFYNLPESKKDELIKTQKHLYKGINQDLIAAIYDMLYTKQFGNKLNVKLRTNSELYSVDFNNEDKKLELKLHQVEQDKYYKIATESLILATGYSYELPSFIEGISDRIQWDDQGRYAVNRNYSIDRNNELYVQNAELHTHGFVTPDLGMACYRNSYIIKELTGIEHYPIEKRIAFQHFDVLEEEKIEVEVEKVEV